MNTLSIYIYYVDLLDCTELLALTSLPVRSTSDLLAEDSWVDDLGVP